MRLPFSEKSNLSGWIIPDCELDFELFFLMLEVLDFPKIFASSAIISKIQEEVAKKNNFSLSNRIQCETIFEKNSRKNIGNIEFFISEDSENS